MARQPLPQPSTTRWLEPEETVRRRWETIVAERRHHLGIHQP
ncbi:hypothetical protein OG350_37600 [Streptomyces achromogenes]|uniref:Uncharacterized protein n=1 Tax=Streptomyces achromogenes TaxID=67255 RepID=A0ABZ1KDV9_STRAH